MSTITEAKVPHHINTQIEVFSEDFWFLFQLEKRKKMSSSTINDLALEEQGYLEKRFIPNRNTPFWLRYRRYDWQLIKRLEKTHQYEQWPLLGKLGSESGRYEIRLSQKGKDWINKYRNMEPEELMSQVKDIFSWGAGLLRVSGGERWHGPYRDPAPLGDTSKDIEFNVEAASCCYRGSHVNYGDSIAGLRRLGWVKSLHLDQVPYHCYLTKKGWRALRYVTDRIPVRMLTRILQERNSYGVGCQKNLRLVLPAIRQIKPKDWLPLCLGIAPAKSMKYRTASWKHTWWHRETSLELVKAAQDLPNFRQVIADLTPEDWDFMLESINPKIINIMATKPELQLSMDIVVKTQLFLKLDDEAIKILIVSQPSFLEALEAIPLCEWATILTKVSPGVRKLIGKIAKKTLARQAA